MKKNKSSRMKKRKKKSSRAKTSKSKQSMRDIVVTPTERQIQASIEGGSIRTLADFRREARY